MNSGINILLVGAQRSSDGTRKSIMQSVKPYSGDKAARLRFQEGSVDEVSFECDEDLGPLHGLLIGTESGTWRLEEAIVSRSGSKAAAAGQVERFVSRGPEVVVGAEVGLGAIWLEPIPEGMTRYGATRLLTSSESSAMKDVDIKDYEEKKRKILAATVALAVGGSFVAVAWAGADNAICYTYGGLVGIAYQWMLQAGVDGLVDSRSQSDRPEFVIDVEAARNELEKIHAQTLEAERQGPFVTRLKRIVGNPALRLGFTAAAGVLAFSLWSVGGVEGQDSGLPRLALGLLGFFSYKVALLLVELTPNEKNQMINKS